MKKLLTYLFIIGSALVNALVYQIFVFPNHFAPSGIGGICTMIQHITGVSVGYLSLLINIPLALAVFFLASKPAAIRGIVFSVALSAFLVLFENYVDLSQLAYGTENSAILGPLVGGVIMGYSCALLLRISAHQGGVHFIAILVNKFHPEFNFTWINFVLNIAIAVVSYFVYGFQLEPVILCVLYCLMSSLVTDKMEKGLRGAVRFEIVTEHPELLSDAIINRLHHSATLIPGKGLYKGKETSVLVCVVNKSQAAALQAIVRSYPGTFAVMSQVNEVMGNFQRLDKEGRPEPELLDAGVTEK